MTLFSMRSALALLLAASLASCGGGGGTSYPVSGSVSGLLYGPLILTTGSQNVSVNPTGIDSTGAANVINYTFPQSLSYGDPFFVTLGANPPHQTCTVGQSAADSAGHQAVINVAVLCVNTPHVVSGYVNGLTADGLLLINGSTSGVIDQSLAVVQANAALTAAGTVTPSFTFPTVYFGQTYGLQVLTQPTGQTCTITNGTGTMGDADVTNVSVNCVANP